jgi:hypothetical protein
MRLGSIEIAEKKFAQKAAPVYMHMFHSRIKLNRSRHEPLAWRSSRNRDLVHV